MEAFQWLLTPGAVFAVLVIVIPLYEPTIRWQRRLKGDIAIAGGLPEGTEKELLQKSIVALAKRLRLYRQAMTPRRTLVKVIAIGYGGMTLVLMILFPPINTPTTKVPIAPSEYMMMAAGLFQMIVILAFISSGRDWGGRTPQQVIALDRTKRYRRRLKKIDRLNTIRSERIKAGEAPNLKSSTLGFSTQVDAMAKYVRNDDVLSVVANTHWAGVGLSDGAQKRLRERGEPIPPELFR